MYHFLACHKHLECIKRAVKPVVSLFKSMLLSAHSIAIFYKEVKRIKLVFIFNGCTYTCANYKS